MQTPTKQTPAGHKAAAAARKPSKGTTTKAAAPAAPLAQVAATLAAAPAPATNAQGVPSASLRGLPATLVINPAQTYKTKAMHNLHWWNNVVAACKDGPADTAALLAGAQGSVAGNYASATGAPGHFIGYAVRKGYLKAGA